MTVSTNSLRIVLRGSLIGIEITYNYMKLLLFLDYASKNIKLMVVARHPNNVNYAALFTMYKLSTLMDPQDMIVTTSSAGICNNLKLL
jgi:hypothetical protein